VALTKTQTRLVEIPHEPGETMTLRILPWKKLQEAAREQQTVAIHRMRDMGGELAATIQKARQEQAQSAQPVEADPLLDYDRATLLRAGIVGWTYEVPVSPEAIDDLDEVTADWAAREILRPSLRSEEERAQLFRHLS
jgi:hypothetical protein